LRAPKRLDRSGRLKRFLEAGYFPEELPPPFVSHSFARYREYLHKAWAPLQEFDKFKSRPEYITVPRYGAARRRLAIPNPINYYRLSREISFGWGEIKKHIASSDVTEFRPIIDADGGRSLFKLDFDIVDRRVAEILSDYNNAFRTDIVKFYQSIYTHSVAWALNDKAWVKRNLNTAAFRESLGYKIDREVRKGQEDQSIGIPIGPDTSRIISEIVAVGLEKELRGLLPNFTRRSVRYVDDIVIGFEDWESSDGVVAALEAAMSHYELDINISKTKIIGANGIEEPDWVAELRACRINQVDVVAQRHDIDRFFNMALVYAEKNEKDAVLKWAMKRARSFPIFPKNRDLYFDLMVRVSRKSMACLPVLAQALIEAKSLGYSFPRGRVQKCIEDVLRVHSRVGHAFEVSWALFLAKGLGMFLDKEILIDVFKLENSLCALLCMDLNTRGLIVGGIDEAVWSPYASPDGLTSPMWLLSYEAAKKGWWSDGARAYVSGHPLFGPMLAKGIFFYDERRNVRRLRRELKAATIQRRRASYILANWKDYI
jgi:hypothetical protein